MSARKAIQDAYKMRITWEAACEIADQQEAQIATLTRKLAYKQAECDRARAATQIVEDRWRKRMEAQKND